MTTPPTTQGGATAEGLTRKVKRLTRQAKLAADWETGGENVDTFQICECGDTDCVGEVEIHSPTDTDPDKSCETEPVRQSGLPSAEQGDRSANTSADVPVGAAGGSVSTQPAGASSPLRSRVQTALKPPTAFADRQSLFDRFTTAQPEADDGWRTHKPGDPMPVAGETLVFVRFENGSSGGDEANPAKEWQWVDQDAGYAIVAYRLAPSQPATNDAQGEEDYIDVDAEDRRSMSLEALVAAAGSQPETVAGEDFADLRAWLGQVRLDMEGGGYPQPVLAVWITEVLAAHTAQAERIKALEYREAVSDKAFSRVHAQVAALTAERDALRGRAERYMAAVGRYYVECLGSLGSVKKVPKHDDPQTAEFRLAADMLRAALTQEQGQ